MPLIPFATKSAPDRGYSGERVVNWFARATEGLSAATLLGRSGAVAQADISGPVRAVFGFNGSLYAVANGNLVKVSGSTVTVIGAVGASEDVSVATNNSQIALIVGSTYYVSDGTTVTSYGTGAISTPVDLAYLDGYIVVIGEGQGRKDLVTVSGLDDATTFSGLDFASAEDNPDALIGIAREGSRLLLFGAETTEEWYNSGDADFPLAPSGRVIEQGLYSKRMLAKEDNSVFFLSEDKVPMRTSGGVPPVISTREIDDALETSVPTYAFTFKERGHKFYAIRRDSASTLVYDITTGLWHERTSGTQEQPWFITCAAQVGGTYYYGTDTGKIVTLDENTFTDDGQAILAEAVSVPIYQPDHFVVSRIHMQVSGGTGSIGRDAKVSLEMSKNGREWGTEKWRNIGNIGEYGKLIEWHGLGAYRRAQIRVRISDPVKRDLHGISYDVAS